MSFVTSVSAVPILKSGKARPIAVAAAKRLKQLPDVPTMSEAGIPGFESDSWNGLFAPKGTPPAIVAKLHEAVAKAVKAPEFREKLESQGGIVVGNTPAEFRDVIRKEVDHWAKVLPSINVKMD
jgi:tripartite-type tricarboxylate transporter receptor subunit TctC